MDIVLKIVEVKPCQERIIVTPIEGVWPFPLLHWRHQETLSAYYIREYIEISE
jgi:hypothetical protein